jgi:hypothetical protein
LSWEIQHSTVKFIPSRWRVVAALLMLALVLPSVRAEVMEAANSRPNIVFLLADDLGWRDLGCMGQEEYRKTKSPGSGFGRWLSRRHADGIRGGIHQE